VKVAPLEPGRHLIVGRTAPADVIVPDDSLSRQHARFLLLDGALLVEDLGSTNGTWIGGEVVTTGTVASGANVLLGNVTAVLHMLVGATHDRVEGHDEFLLAVEHEHRRGRQFKRPFCVLMIAARHPPGQLIHDWLSALIGFLRPVDRVALFGFGTLEILLPELDRASALAMVSQVRKASATELVCGVAAYPETATSVDALLAACFGELERAQRREVDESDADAKPADTRPDLIAASPSMRDVLALAQRLAASTLPVLVHGETGVGKEVLCRLIHEASVRSSKSFVAVNCAAIPTHLVESTLFGHVKGAFTGASQPREGLFEAADGGTLLLDEIGDLPLAIQATLLRVLENGTVMRVGETRERTVDVRVLAATNRDLEAMVERDEFRSDLFYRLNGARLDIPPLRERRSDILPLAERFLADVCADGRVASLSEQARDALLGYSWPGNTRELRNTVHRAAVIAQHDVIGAEDLPARVRGGPRSRAVSPPLDGGEEPSPQRLLRDGESFRACLERLESSVLREALTAAGGNQSEAARRLDMPRRTLVHKIKTLGLRNPREPS
jgi:DNA-binding NtrC family response regulator